MENKSLLNKLESINEQLNLTHYWIIFLKYRRIVLLAPIFFGVLGFFIALNINPIFQSQATLVIEESTKNIVNIEEVYSGDGGRNAFRNINYINNQIQIIESDEVLGNIFLDEKIKVKAEALYRKLAENFLIRSQILNFFKSEKAKNNEQKIDLKKYIKNNLTVSQVRNSDVVNILVTSGNPELAKFLLEQVIDSYLKYDVDTKVRVTNYANAQINLRLSKLLDQMEIAEQKLLNYKKENNLIDIGDIKELKIDQIKSVSKRIIDANRELQKKQNDLTAIKLADGNVEELLAIADLRSKKEVDAIRTNINVTNDNIEALQIIYKDEHPKVKKVLKTKINLDNRLKEILDENIAAAAYELANLKGFITISEEELNKAKFDLQDLEEKDVALQQFVREVETNNKIYETFLQRMKETNEVKELQSSNVRIIQNALLPLSPISPNIFKITMLFYILSFGAIFILLVYFEFNSNTVIEPSNLDELNIPVLATLPSVKKIDKGYHLSQMFIEDVDSEFSESIRTLRTLLVAKFQKNKTILLSSTYSGEGKTTISLNTALAFSKIGKVLLVETDIRRPSVLTKTTQGDEAPKVGFSDLIQGGVNMSDCIMKLPGSEIEVMTSGTRRSDLTDLTTTKKLKTFFDVLKQNYDYVIIDTPPIQPVTDTLFISQATDHNLIIVRANVTKLVGIKSVIKKLDNVGVKVDGLVLNDLDTSKASYYGYYQYGGYSNKYKSYS
ncbi:GumC family protein [Candidatus Pelagibacter sp. Uisw_137]|uniref:GumC family protein n=1 Tax=Candidatus Pelagibacter sp. Uisw_137 TaxID=3230992 RepID=UPI0039E81AF3